MQYVKVVVDQPLGNLEELTYSIPAEILPEIKIGQLVEVTVRGKMVRGLIVGLIKRTAFVKTDPIIKVLSSGSVVNKAQLKFFRAVSRLFLASLSDTVFFFLPPKLKSVEIDIKESQTTPTAKVKYIFGTTKQRFDWYKKIIKMDNQSIVFIFPDILSLSSFSQYLKIKHLVYTGKLSAKKRWSIYQAVNSLYHVILTTRIGIGLPYKFPCCVVIDQPAHPGHKEDHRPKYNLSIRAKLLSENFTQLIFGSDIPTLNDVFSYHVSMVRKRNITIHSSRELLPVSILETVSSYQRILVVAPKKGEWGGLICQKCQQLLLCPQCQKPLGQWDSATLYCSHCQKLIDGFLNCPICRSYKLRGFGIGTHEIKNRLEIYLKIPVIEAGARNLTQLNSRSVIVVGNFNILSLPVARFDIAICLGFDRLLDIVKYNQEEVVFSNLLRFSLLSDKTYIVTNRPNQRVFGALARGNYSDFYQALTLERKDIFPPYTREINFIAKNERYSQKMVDLIKTNSTLNYDLSLKNKKILKTYFSYSGEKEIRRQKTELERFFAIDPDPR